MLKLIKEVSADTETLFVLDDLNTLLFAYTALYNPDPAYDYAEETEDEINQSIAELIDSIPQSHRPTALAEVEFVKGLVSSKDYKRAREHLRKVAQAITDPIADGRKPPADIRALVKSFNGHVD